MTNTYFKSKEQYLQFRTAFTAATKNKKAKSTVSGDYRKRGWLGPEHFIFLNIMRGKPYHNGFVPVTSKNKLTNGGRVTPGLDAGIQALLYAIHSAEDVKQLPSLATIGVGGSNFTKFIEPLIDISDEFMSVKYMEILCSLRPALEEHRMYDSFFGEGLKISRKMLAEDLKPKNYEEFLKIVDEISNENVQKVA